MKSITLHALDDQLADSIKRLAREKSLSMNEFVKQTLAEALGIKVPATPPHQNDFAAFRGTWSADDAEAFEERAADTERVDPEDWK